MSRSIDLAAVLVRASERPRALSLEELTSLLRLGSEAERKLVRDAAYALKCRSRGKLVSMRGIVEMGNVCAKDCFYCGIRRSNHKLDRYQLSVEDVARMAERDAAQGYASLVLQGGEIESEDHTRYIEECLAAIRPLGLGVTLSLGEQTEATYRRWREAGAERYLLRIETSNPALYSTLHPADHDWERRVECLRALRRCDYQVGTGVMCGLPGQSVEDLARDIVFFGEMDVDMIGMGPYIPHPDTPLSYRAPAETAAERLERGLDMIAATRLYLHDVNIAATTALQALAHDGRERGILAGANVMMPNITDTDYRRRYQLYVGKPCLDENAAMCRGCLERRLAAIGEKVNYGNRGDSPHYFKRKGMFL